MSSDSLPIDTTVDIVTPENIAFHYQVAGPFRRFPAYLIDVLIRVLALLRPGSAGRLCCRSASEPPPSRSGSLRSSSSAGFTGVCSKLTGTVRRRANVSCGIRVLSANGRPVNGYQAILRNIMRTVDLGPMISAEILGGPAVPLIPVFTVGLVVMAVNRRFQRLGDVVCKTMVVVEDRPWLAGVAKIEDPRAFQLASYLPADLQVSRGMARALAHYAERRQYFSPPRAARWRSTWPSPCSSSSACPAIPAMTSYCAAMYYRLFIADRGDDEAHVARVEAALAGSHPVSVSPLLGHTPDTPRPRFPRGEL